MAANKQKLSLQSTVLKDAMTLAFYNVEAGKLAALGLGALTIYMIYMIAFMRTSRKASTPGPARPGSPLVIRARNRTETLPTFRLPSRLRSAHPEPPAD